MDDNFSLLFMADLKSCLFTTSCLLISALILICLYSQARNSSRDQRRNQKNKNPKIQNLSEGPETFGFFGFPRVFLFSNRNPKNHVVFLDFKWKNQKKHRVFWFSCSVFGEKPKNPCFLDFCWKTKKHHVLFWISVRKQQKTLGKPKNPKVSGPSERFWIFGFVVPSAETKKTKIQNLAEGPETFGFLGFPRVFLFSNRNPKNHVVFLDFKWKNQKKTQGFLVFLFGLW